MGIYVIVAILLSILSLGNSSRFKLIVSFILLTVIGGLRDISVGTDTQNYSLLFENYGTDISNMFHASEPLYLCLQYYVAVHGWPYQTLVFVIMALTMTGITFFAKKISRNSVLVLLSYYLLYFYFYSLNLMRQYIAISIILVSFYYLYSNQIKNYVLCVAIACLFHVTAIIGLLGIIVNKCAFSSQLQICLLLFTLIVGVTPFIQVVSANMLGFLPSYLFDYVIDYNTGKLSLPVSRILLTLFGIMLVIVMKENLFVKLFVVGVCILNMFSFQPIMGRIAQFFTIAQIGIIPNISTLIKKEYYKNVSAIKLVSYAYMWVVWMYLISSNVGEVRPYTVFF